MIRLIGVAATAYFVYAALGFLLQRRMLFPGTHLRPFREVSVDSLPGVRQLWFDNGAGRSEAWFLPASEPARGHPRPAVIFQHGNAEFIDDWHGLFPALQELGVGALLLEYPGYGRSTGMPTESSIEVAAVAAFDWLLSQPEVDPQRVLVMGRSLGGAAALALARRRPAAAAIVQSAFTSVGALAVRAYLLPPFLARDPFDNLDALESFPGPTLVFHGEHDKTIPFRHGVELAGASERATLVPLDCGHNDCPPSWDEFWATVETFLREEGILEAEE